MTDGTVIVRQALPHERDCECNICGRERALIVVETGNKYSTNVVRYCGSDILRLFVAVRDVTIDGERAFNA